MNRALQKLSSTWHTSCYRGASDAVTPMARGLRGPVGVGPMPVASVYQAHPHKKPKNSTKKFLGEFPNNQSVTNYIQYNYTSEKMCLVISRISSLLDRPPPYAPVCSKCQL